MSRKRKLDSLDESNERENKQMNVDEHPFVPPLKRRNIVETANELHTDTNNQPQSPHSFKVEWFGASDKGKKAHMEDRRIEMPVLSQISQLPYFQQNECSLFGILDGHDGHKVVTYLQNQLPLIFFERFEKYVKNEPSASNERGIPPLEGAGGKISGQSNDNNNNNHHNNKNRNEYHMKDGKLHESVGKVLDVQKCLHATFKVIDEKILNWISPMKREGATGTLIFRDNNTFWCANVGDSKAVLARRDTENGKLKPLQLSKNHTVLQLSEVRRVEACGGHVANGRVNGVLEVTRSFGDPEFKKYGVIAVPQISKFQITDRDEFLVAACDGLWSVFSIADCIKFVNEKLNHKSQPDVREVVRQLLAEAILNKQAKDNVSAIIIRFKHNK